jgi:CRP-like cAMP-binding protein
LIVEGFAGRVTFLPGGGRQLLAFDVAGDFCDLHSFVLPRMDHAIQALSECKVAKFPHARLAELSAKFPELSRALWWDTAVDAAVHREWMIGLGRRSAYERIAHLQCEMFLRLKAIGRTKGNSYDLAITQEDFGDAV